MASASTLVYFIIETDSRIRVIHKTRDSALFAYKELQKLSDFDFMLVMKEIRVDSRGQVLSEVITHSFSPLSSSSIEKTNPNLDEIGSSWLDSFL